MDGIGYSYFIPKNEGVQLGRGRNVGAHCIRGNESECEGSCSNYE